MNPVKFCSCIQNLVKKKKFRFDPYLGSRTPDYSVGMHCVSDYATSVSSCKLSNEPYCIIYICLCSRTYLLWESKLGSSY